MQRFNVLTGELPVAQDRSGYAWRGRRGVARELGLRWLGASVYELPDAQWTFPYHYHHGVEEWLYVVAGAPTLRDAGRGAGAGAWGCGLFPERPGRSARGPRARPRGDVLRSGGGRPASVSVYPDSDKLGVRPPGGGPDRLDFRRGDAVDYWDGE